MQPIQNIDYGAGGSSWSVAGSVTGQTDSISIPSGATELLAVFNPGGSVSIRYTVSIPCAALSSTETYFNTGKYVSGSDNGAFNALATTSSIRLGQAMLNGGVVSSTTTLTVYYR